MPAKYWVEQWTKLDSLSIEKFRTVYLNHSDITEISCLSFQAFTLNTVVILMSISVWLLQRSAHIQIENEIGLEYAAFTGFVVSVLYIGFLWFNANFQHRALNYLLGSLELLSLLFVCVLGSRQDVIVKPNSVESTQIYLIKWGVIYSMIFGLKGMFLWLMNSKKSGIEQRMLFSAIYSAQQNNEGLKT